MDDIDRFLARQNAQPEAAPQEMDDIDRFLAKQNAAPSKPVRAASPEKLQEAEEWRAAQLEESQAQAAQAKIGSERRDAISARKKELRAQHVPGNWINDTIKREFARTEEQELEDFGEAGAVERFLKSAVSQAAKGGHNVANKVDNFISDRFGDDTKGGGIIDDAKYAERDRKNDLMAENAGLAGTAGRFVGDALLTAPVDAVGGRILRPLGKAILSTKKGKKWAADAKNIQDNVVTAGEEAITKRKEAVQARRGLNRTTNQRALAPVDAAKAELKDVKREAGPLWVASKEARDRQKMISAEREKVRLPMRGKREPEMEAGDIYRRQALVDNLPPELKREFMSKVSEADRNAGNYTRNLAAYQALDNSARSTANAAEKAVREIDRTRKTAAKNIPKAEKAASQARKQGYAGNPDLPDVPARADRPATRAQQKSDTRFQLGVNKQFEDDMAALGPRPGAGLGRAMLGRTAAGNAVGGAVGGAGSAAILADEGKSLEAAGYGALAGGIAGGFEGTVGRLAGPIAWAAEKGPYAASLTQPEVLSRYMLRAASGQARKYKESITGTLRAFADNTNPGGLKQTIDKIRDVGAGRHGAGVTEEEQQRQQ